MIVCSYRNDRYDQFGQTSIASSQVLRRRFAGRLDVAPPPGDREPWRITSGAPSCPRPLLAAENYRMERSNDRW